jgi:hypothetical protein
MLQREVKALVNEAQFLHTTKTMATSPKNAKMENI